MTPFRLRVVTAIVVAFLMLGSLGSAANAAQIPPASFPEDPWDSGIRVVPPSFGLPTTSFPEDPWPGLGN
jgi:hypothetical protein